MDELMIKIMVMMTMMMVIVRFFTRLVPLVPITWSQERLIKHSQGRTNYDVQNVIHNSKLIP